MGVRLTMILLLPIIIMIIMTIIIIILITNIMILLIIVLSAPPLAELYLPPGNSAAQAPENPRSRARGDVCMYVSM